ncbi:hypothetical protein AK88_04659 [Plasmodium fragile]|uniref:Uncharacterized protein n=1 Tax=Plasmodium fragile TaxID=5857 RepID=A0A0D9QFV1_PLAFR|nr:uncharacterized protein AK88_04659 [Plasmodium fragile]KJP85682.1 hypothetical protein AK88_04659 [Plasmodium fragile]
MDSLNNSNILRNYKKSVQDIKRLKTSAFNLKLHTKTENYHNKNPANAVNKNNEKYTISHDESEIFPSSNHFDANLFSDNRPFLCDSRTYYSKHSIDDNHVKRVADMDKQEITNGKHESNIVSLNKAHLNVENKFVRNNSTAKYGINLNKSLDKISKIRIMQKFRRSIHSHANERDEHRNGTFEHINLFDKHTQHDSIKAKANSNNNMKFKDSYHYRLDSASTCDREEWTNNKKVNHYKKNSFHDNTQNSIRKYLNEVPPQNGRDINSNCPSSNQIRSKPTVIASNIISLSTEHTAIFNGKKKFPQYLHPMNHSEKVKNVSTSHLNNNDDCDSCNYVNIKMGNNPPDGISFQKSNFPPKKDLNFGINKRMEHLNLSHYFSNHVQGGKSVNQEHSLPQDTQRKDELIHNKGANWNDTVMQFMNEYMEKKQYLQNLEKFNDGLKNNPSGNANALISNFNLRHSFDMSINSNVLKNNKYTNNNYFKKTVQNKNSKSKLYEHYVDFEKEFRGKTDVQNFIKKTNEQAAVLCAANKYDEQLHPHYHCSNNNTSAERTLSSVHEKKGVVKSEPLKACGNACKKQEIKDASSHIINIPLNFKLKKKKIINYKNIIQDSSSKKQHNYTNALSTQRYRNFLNIEKEQKQQKQQNTYFNDKAEIFNEHEFLSSFLKTDLHDEQCMHVEKLFNSDVDDTMSNQRREQAKQQGENKMHGKSDHADHNAHIASAQLTENINHIEKQRLHNCTSNLSTHIGPCGQGIHVKEPLHEQQPGQVAGLKETNADHENEEQESCSTVPELTQNVMKTGNEDEDRKNGNIERADFSARNIVETQSLNEQNGPRQIEQRTVKPAIFEKETKEEECLEDKNQTCKGSDTAEDKQEEVDIRINWEFPNNMYSSNTDNEASLKSSARRADQEAHSVGISSSIQNDGTSQSTISKFLKDENMDKQDSHEHGPGTSEQDVEMGIEKGYYCAQCYHTNGGNKYANIEGGTIYEDKKRRNLDLQQEAQITTKEEQEEETKNKKKKENVPGECFNNISEHKASTTEDEAANSEICKKDQKRIISDDITKGETDKSNSLTSHDDVEHFNAPTKADAKEEVSAIIFKQQNNRNIVALLNEKIEAEEQELTLECIRTILQTQCTEEATNEKKGKKKTTHNGYTMQDETAIRTTNNNDCVRVLDQEKLERCNNQQKKSPNMHENKEHDVLTHTQETQAEPNGDGKEPKCVELENENMYNGNNTEEFKQKMILNECEKGDQAESGYNACIGETLDETIPCGNKTIGEQYKNAKDSAMNCGKCKESNNDHSEKGIPISSIAPEEDDESSNNQRVSTNGDMGECKTSKRTYTESWHNSVTPNGYAFAKPEFNEKNIYSPAHMLNDDNVNTEIPHIDSNKVTRGETITGCSQLCIEINKHELFKQLHIKENRLRHINCLYHSFDYDKGTVSKERGNGPEYDRQSEQQNASHNERKNEISTCSTSGTKKDRTERYAHITHFEEKLRRIFNPAQDQNGVVPQRSNNMQTTRNATNEPINEKIDNAMEGNKYSHSNILLAQEKGCATLQNDPILLDTETEMVKEEYIQMEDKHSSVSDAKAKDHLIDHRVIHSTDGTDDENDDDTDDDADENVEETNILYEDIKRNLWLQNTNLSQNTVQYIQVESVKCIMLFCYLHKIKYFQGMHDMIISLFYLNLQPYEILCVFENILYYYAPYMFQQHSCMYSSPGINASIQTDTISCALSNITMQICNTNGKLFRLLFQYFFPYVSYYVDAAVSDTWPSLFFLNLIFSKFDNVFCLLYIWVRLIQMKNQTSEVTCDFILFILSFCMHKLRIIKREFYEKRGLITMTTNSPCALSWEDKKRDDKYTQEQAAKCSHKVIQQIHAHEINSKKAEHNGEDERQAIHEESGTQEDNKSDNEIHHPIQTKRKYTQKEDEKAKEVIRKIKLSTYSSEMFSLFFEFSSSFDDHFGDKYKIHIDYIINDIPKIRDIVPPSFLQFLTKYNSVYQKKKKNKTSNSFKNLYGYTKNQKLSDSLTLPEDDHLCLHIKLSDLLFIHNNVEGYYFVFLRLVKCQIILSNLILINRGNLVIENFARFKNVEEFVKHKKKIPISNKCRRAMYIVLVCSQENNEKLKDWDINVNDRYLHEHNTHTASNEINGSKNVCSNRVFFKRSNRKEYMCSEHNGELPVDRAYLKNLITTLVKNNFKRLAILKVHPKVVKIRNKENITEKETTDGNAPVKENSFFFHMFNIVKKKIYTNITKDSETNKNTPPQSNEPQNNHTKFALEQNNSKMFNDKRIRKRINCSNRKPVLYSNITHENKDEIPARKLNNEVQNGSSGMMKNKVDNKIHMFPFKLRKRNESKRLVHGFKIIGKRMNLSSRLFPKPYVDAFNKRPTVRKRYVHRTRTKQRQKKSLLRILKTRELNLDKNKAHSNNTALYNKTDEEDKSGTKMHISGTNYKKKNSFIFINRAQLDENIKEGERKNAREEKKKKKKRRSGSCKITS